LLCVNVKKNSDGQQETTDRFHQVLFARIYYAKLGWNENVPPFLQIQL